MANEGGHELARWVCAIGGAFLVHGALLLSSSLFPPVIAAVVPRDSTLVWLDAAVAAPAPEPGIAGLARTDEPPAPSPRRAEKPRAKLSRPAAVPKVESAPPPSAEGPSDALAPSPLGAEPPTDVAGELASSGAAPWGVGAAAAMAGGGGSGGADAAVPDKPSFPPGLMAVGNPCRGFYPAAADVDHGEVRVVVRVGRDGTTRGSDVVEEVPSRQGFGPAARACVARLRFRPARDAGGDAIPGQALLALSFDRS
jgi:protein TonB